MGGTTDDAATRAPTVPRLLTEDDVATIVAEAERSLPIRVAGISCARSADLKCADASGVAQGDSQQAIAPGDHRDEGGLATQPGMMFVRRQGWRQGLGLTHRGAHQAVAPQRLFQAIPGHGLATKAGSDDVGGHSIAQQPQPLLDLFDGAAAIGQDKAGSD